MKTDFSDWCIDETLLQLMNNVWRLCVYYSKKNASAECNYEIYDKEMLIIIQCLKEWDAELRSVSNFQICTDHKNLKYFMTVKKLTEWQMRWFHIVTIQLLHIIFVEKSEWENRHFVKTWARYANRCLRWQSTALYDRYYTLRCCASLYRLLNDSSKYTELSACTRSDLFDEITDLEQM
jgi:hypothetical protein